MKLFLRVADGSDADVVSDKTGLKCVDKSRTKQEFKEECDINTIIDRFGIGYEIPQGVRVPQYADFSDAMDFHDALNAVRQASESFMAMSAATRAEFGNDAARFVEFCSRPENLPRMRQLGLAVDELPVAPGAVLASPAAPAAPGAAPAAAGGVPTAPAQ